MNAEELLSLMTIGAVAPYIVVAAPGWVRRVTRLAFGAHAPGWSRHHGHCSRTA